MNNYNTFAQTEALLLAALSVKGRSIKFIGEASGIKPSCLYKWKTSEVHLSPDKADALLLYFMENEPQRLALAEIMLASEKNEL